MPIEVLVWSGLVDMQRVGLVPRCTSVRVPATYKRTGCTTWRSTALSTVTGSWCGLACLAVTTTPIIATKVPSADWRYLYRRSLFLGRVDTFPSVEEPGGGTNSISTQELLGFANWRDYPLFPVATSLRRAEGETKTR